MTVPVLWLPPHQQWDQAILRDLMGGYLTPPGLEFEHHQDQLPHGTKGAVIVVPGRYDGAEEKVADAIPLLDWVLVMVTGDEESSFQWWFDHPNPRWWFMDPRPDLPYPDGARFLGSGYPPWLRAELAKHRQARRQWQWSYAGQVNHYRRQQVVDVLTERGGGGVVLPSPGFTKGLAHDEYAALLADTEVIPCPSGKHTPESFRVFEALEAGCVPIIDELCPDYNPQGRFWPMIFGEGPWPFHTIEDWADLPKHLDAAGAGWQGQSNACFAYWQLHKRAMGGWLVDDLAALGVQSEPDRITVLLPTSPIESHPSTAIIEETIASVRHWLPDAEILVMIDGVRDEQVERRADYEEFTRRILWKMNHEWRRVVPVLFDSHHHQAAMTRHTLSLVRTPLVLFVEHDTPLVVDEDIPLHWLGELVMRGELNVVRLFHEGVRQPAHRHLELDDRPWTFDAGPLIGDVEVPVLRTMQWSQRPHVASTAFYRDLMARHFTDGARTMIEDVLHGRAEESWRHEGEMGWNLWRIGIYSPDGNLKRSYHLDGRGSESKFESTMRA